jgi:hypothetical protein
MSRLSRQCGILNISQPCRPTRPVAWIALLLHLTPSSRVGFQYIDSSTFPLTIYCLCCLKDAVIRKPEITCVGLVCYWDLGAGAAGSSGSGCGIEMQPIKGNPLHSLGRLADWSDWFLCHLAEWESICVHPEPFPYPSDPEFIQQLFTYTDSACLAPHLLTRWSIQFTIYLLFQKLALFSCSFWPPKVKK